MNLNLPDLGDGEAKKFVALEAAIESVQKAAGAYFKNPGVAPESRTALNDAVVSLIEVGGYDPSARAVISNLVDDVFQQRGRGAARELAQFVANAAFNTSVWIDKDFQEPEEVIAQEAGFTALQEYAAAAWTRLLGEDKDLGVSGACREARKVFNHTGAQQSSPALQMAASEVLERSGWQGPGFSTQPW